MNNIIQTQENVAVDNNESSSSNNNGNDNNNSNSSDAWDTSVLSMDNNDSTIDQRIAQTPGMLVLCLSIITGLLIVSSLVGNGCVLVAARSPTHRIQSKSMHIVYLLALNLAAADFLLSLVYSLSYLSHLSVTDDFVLSGLPCQAVRLLGLALDIEQMTVCCLLCVDCFSRLHSPSWGLRTRSMCVSWCASFGLGTMLILITLAASSEEPVTYCSWGHKQVHSLWFHVPFLTFFAAVVAWILVWKYRHCLYKDSFVQTFLRKGLFGIKPYFTCKTKIGRGLNETNLFYGHSDHLPCAPISSCPFKIPCLWYEGKRNNEAGKSHNFQNGSSVPVPGVDDNQITANEDRFFSDGPAPAIFKQIAYSLHKSIFHSIHSLANREFVGNSSNNAGANVTDDYDQLSWEMELHEAVQKWLAFYGIKDDVIDYRGINDASFYGRKERKHNEEYKSVSVSRCAEILTSKDIGDCFISNVGGIESCSQESEKVGNQNEIKMNEIDPQKTTNGDKHACKTHELSNSTGTTNACQTETMRRKANEGGDKAHQKSRPEKSASLSRSLQTLWLAYSPKSLDSTESGRVATCSFSSSDDASKIPWHQLVSGSSTSSNRFDAGQEARSNEINIVNINQVLHLSLEQYREGAKYWTSTSNAKSVLDDNSKPTAAISRSSSYDSLPKPTSVQVKVEGDPGIDLSTPEYQYNKLKESMHKRNGQYFNMVEPASSSVDSCDKVVGTFDGPDTNVTSQCDQNSPNVNLQSFLSVPGNLWPNVVINVRPEEDHREDEGDSIRSHQLEPPSDFDLSHSNSVKTFYSMPTSRRAFLTELGLYTDICEGRLLLDASQTGHSDSEEITCPWCLMREERKSKDSNANNTSDQQMAQREMTSILRHKYEDRGDCVDRKSGVSSNLSTGNVVRQTDFYDDFEDQRQRTRGRYATAVLIVISWQLICWLPLVILPLVQGQTQTQVHDDSWLSLLALRMAVHPLFYLALTRRINM